MITRYNIDLYLDTDKNKDSIRNLVERILCVIGCVGVVLLALSWTFFYMVKQCKYM